MSEKSQSCKNEYSDYRYRFISYKMSVSLFKNNRNPHCLRVRLSCLCVQTSEENIFYKTAPLEPFRLIAQEAASLWTGLCQSTALVVNLREIH